MPKRFYVLGFCVFLLSFSCQASSGKEKEAQKHSFSFCDQDLHYLFMMIRSVLEKNQKEGGSPNYPVHLLNNRRGDFEKFHISYDLLSRLCSRDEKGKLVQKKTYGNHPVFRLPQGAFFKTNTPASPLDFSSEQASYFFHTLLFGKGRHIPPSVLLVFEYPPFEKEQDEDTETASSSQGIHSDSPSSHSSGKSLTSEDTPPETLRPPSRIFIQASQTISGENFQDFLNRSRGGENILESIDLLSFAQLFVTGFLSYARDSKPDNFILRKNQLFSVDNDYAFEYPLRHDENNTGGEIKISFRNALCLYRDLLRKQMPEEVKHSLSQKGDFFLLEWLSCLLRQDYMYEKLLKKNIISLSDYNHQGLGMRFHASMIEDLRKSMHFVHFLVKKNVSLETFFRLCAPLTHEYYKKLLLEHETPEKALSYLYKDPDPLEDYLDPLYLLQSGRRVEEALQQEKEKVIALSEEKKKPLRKIIEDFPMSKTSFLRETMQSNMSPEDLHFLFKTPENPLLYFRELDMVDTLRCYAKDQLSRRMGNKGKYLDIDVPVEIRKNNVKTYQTRKFYLAKNKLTTIQGSYLGSSQSKEAFWGYEAPTFWLKALPEIPAFEEASSEFIRMLFGRGALKNSLVRVDNKPYLYVQKPFSKRYFSLSEVLKKPEILEKIDSQSFSEMFFISLVLNPVYWSSQDFIIEEETVFEDKKYVITSVHNEFMFSPTEVDNKVQSHSLLYTFKQMEDFFDPRVSKKILAIEKIPVQQNADRHFVHLWKEKILEINQKHKVLFSEGEITHFRDTANVHLKFPYFGSLFNRIMTRLDYAQEILKDHPPLKNRDLFEHVKYLPQSISDVECFESNKPSYSAEALFDFMWKTLVGSFENISPSDIKTSPIKTLDVGTVQEEVSTLIKTTLEGKVPLEIESALKKGEKKALHLLFSKVIEPVRRAFLRDFRFDKFSLDFKQEYVSLLSQSLTRGLFLNGFKNTPITVRLKREGTSHLRELQFVDSSVPKNFFSSFCKEASCLERLTFWDSKDPYLGGHPWTSGWEKISFPHLKILDVRRCAFLKGMGELHVPHLEKVILEGCPSLNRMVFSNTLPQFDFIFPSDTDTFSPLTIELASKKVSDTIKLPVPKERGKQIPFQTLLKPTSPLYPFLVPAKKGWIPPLWIEDKYNEIFFQKHLKGSFLHLEDQDISDLFLENILEALVHKSGLRVQSLSLKNNRIGDRGAQTLVSLGGALRELRKLDLSSNVIQERGALDLYHMFENSFSLLYLDLDGNSLDLTVMDKIRKLNFDRVIRFSIENEDISLLNSLKLTSNIKNSFLESKKTPILSMSQSLVREEDILALKTFFRYTTRKKDPFFKEIDISNNGLDLF